MPEQQKKSFLINLAFIIAVVLCVYFFIKYLLSWMFPFFIGLLVAALLQPAINILVERTPIKKRGASIFVTVLFYLVVFLFIWLLGLYVIGEIGAFSSRLPRILNDMILPMIAGANDNFARLLENISPELSQTFSASSANLFEAIKASLLSLPASTFSGVAEMAKKVPLMFLTFIFSIVSSVMISLDYTRVTGFIKKQLPERVRGMFHGSGGMLVGSLLKMLRAYIIILLITFTEMCVALFIMGVENFAAIAAVVAILDILPVLGTGTVIIPWAIFSVLTNNFGMAVGLIVTYLAVTIIRNSIEPKIVGSQIGLHPIVTITAMYLGLRVLGMPGLFVAPILALVIKHINDEGYFKIYEKPPVQEK